MKTHNLLNFAYRKTSSLSSSRCSLWSLWKWWICTEDQQNLNNLHIFLYRLLRPTKLECDQMCKHYEFDKEYKMHDWRVSSRVLQSIVSYWTECELSFAEARVHKVDKRIGSRIYGLEIVFPFRKEYGFAVIYVAR